MILSATVSDLATILNFMKLIEDKVFLYDTVVIKENSMSEIHVFAFQKTSLITIFV